MSSDFERNDEDDSLFNCLILVDRQLLQRL